MHGIALSTEGISDLFTGTAGAEAGHAQVLLGAGVFFRRHFKGRRCAEGGAVESVWPLSTPADERSAAAADAAPSGQGSTSPMILSIASCTVPPSGGR